MLDSQTTLILAALLFWMLPLLVWWTTGGRRSEAVLCWCLGSVLAGLGITLMGLRPWIPAWLSFQGGNSCLLLSFVGWAQSLRVLGERPWSKAQLALWTVLVPIFYSALVYGLDPAGRSFGMRLALGGLALYTAFLTWPLVRRWRSHNALAIGVSYGLLGLGLWLQLAAGHEAHVQPSPFSQTWDASLIALLALLTSAVGHFCYAGMVLDRSTRERLQQAQAQAGAEEMARLDVQLRQSDRQGRMVLVTGTLAHELNQPLTAALTQAQVAQRRLQTGRSSVPVLTDLLLNVEAGIERASRILTRARQAGRVNTMKLNRVDVRQVVHSSLDFLEPEWQRLQVQVRRDMGDVPLWSQADEVALSQVLVNVLRNAGQAMESSPQRWLQVSAWTQDQLVLLRIRDHGTGVPPEVLARWGEPFVSTRLQGLGMGLAICRDIMEQHHGGLVLSNAAGGGAEVIITLPLEGRST